MKTNTQEYDICTHFTHSHLYKISPLENLAADSLARQAILAAVDES